MEILHLNRHAMCPHFIGKSPVGFSMMESHRGEKEKLDSRFSAIVFMLMGKLKVSGEKFSSFILPSSHMVLLPSGMTHEMEMLEDGRSLCMYIIGDRLNFCSNIVSDSRLYPPSVCPGDSVETKEMQLDVPCDCPISPMEMKPTICQFAELMETYVRDQMLCCDIHAMKQRELEALLQAYYETDELVEFLMPLTLSNASFFEKVTALSEDFLTIDQMAERLYMSRSTFIRNFNTVFGKSYNRWTIKKKANVLYRGLKYTDEPLEHMADRLKFSSQQSMNAFCKTHLGGTPLQIRQGKVELELMDKKN
ncbi:MAG: helix-turn-helix domain-containing protein [Prevotellaceae bacterium]|nr:helix-turn-helix domain-containing protein [Prevotella sp.]MDD7256843.1 helix-turn-helix domain-containing protein [Prevotellaceae bacterium]MDY6131582.1 helix-turn-helix domain-containing protein [Prevotella sp.]